MDQKHYSNLYQKNFERPILHDFLKPIVKMLNYHLVFHAISIALKDTPFFHICF